MSTSKWLGKDEKRKKMDKRGRSRNVSPQVSIRGRGTGLHELVGEDSRRSVRRRTGLEKKIRKW